MKKLLIVSFMTTALIYTAATPRVGAQDCSTPGPFREVMQQLTKECKNLGGADLAKCVASAPLYTKIIAIWNNLAGNGPLKIGPREAVYNQTEAGDIVPPGDRRYLAAPSDKSSVTLSVKKKGGKGKVVLSICKVNGDGIPTHLDTFTFQPDAPVGQEYRKTFSGALGQGFDMFMDGQGLLTQFQYDLKLSK